MLPVLATSCYDVGRDTHLSWSHQVLEATRYEVGYKGRGQLVVYDTVVCVVTIPTVL